MLLLYLLDMDYIYKCGSLYDFKNQEVLCHNLENKENGRKCRKMRLMLLNVIWTY